MKIIWKEKIIGESNNVMKWGNEYFFPAESVDMRHIVKNTHRLYCPDKGYADCYDLVVGGEIERNGAWVYPYPYPQSIELAGRFGFKYTRVIE